MFYLILVMVLAGLLGGTINYLLGRSAGEAGVDLWKSLAAGLGASFLVPLFLNMISSNLIGSIRGTRTAPGDPYQLLVFAGFSLVAAISSTAFIRSLSERFLNELKATRKEVNGVRKVAENAQAEAAHATQEASVLEPILAKLEEPESHREPVVGGAVALELSSNQQAVLRALGHSKWSLRTLSGVAQETGLTPVEASEVLQGLVQQGLAGQRHGKAGERWFINQAGLDALRSSAFKGDVADF